MNLVLHFQRGGKVEKVTLSGVSAGYARRAVNSLGKLRASNGAFTFAAEDGVLCAIPAQNVVLIEARP